MEQEAVVALEHVSIRLGGRAILEDVNMTVGEGEFIVMLGPNGAGKSTLLKLLLVLKPSTGIVRVLGKTPRRGNEAIGYAPSTGHWRLISPCERVMLSVSAWTVIVGVLAFPVRNGML